jgi:hypothetical protein
MPIKSSIRDESGDAHVIRGMGTLGVLRAFRNVEMLAKFAHLCYGERYRNFDSVYFFLMESENSDGLVDN